MTYINTPFNYTGSKFKLLEQIIPKLDYNKDYFVDLFCGGGSVYTNVVDKYKKVLVNDIITELIGIHKGLVLSDDIIEQTKLLCPDKEDSQAYDKLRNSFNEDKSPEKLWALMLSCTNNMLRFNQKGGFNQTFGKRSWNDSTTKKVDTFTEHIRQYKDKLIFTSKSFKEINLNKPSMVYIDPPYGYVKEKNGNIGTKQISEAGYNNYYYQQDDIDLYNYCHKLNDNSSSFMISGVLKHDDKICWILDKLISDGFNYKVLNFDYNKVSRKGDKETTEIIIMNYE